MFNDEVSVLRDALSSHRAILSGALSANGSLDIRRAFAVHAEMTRILSRWDEFSASEQRDIVATVQYIIDTDDDENDLTSADGFVDDQARVRRLMERLGER